MKKLITLIFLISLCTAHAQAIFYQYFDGADTGFSAINIQLDTSQSNVWQIGRPQKTIFTEASTQPNALLTDSLNPYPQNAASSFSFEIPTIGLFSGILALQWTQKLDMDTALDGGVIEFSIDTGATWQNVFYNPYVYNFFGFDQANVDTLPNGEIGFTGRDTAWTDVWLCVDASWISTLSSYQLRFTFYSDSVDNGRDGWMIDNMQAHQTWVHTINEVKTDKYLQLNPNPTAGMLNIRAKKTGSFHIIEKMELMDANGRVVETYGQSPTKFSIDISHLPNGIYYLKVQTNMHVETQQILLQR